jgi:uncharacterized protein (TIGR00730 family)
MTVALPSPIRPDSPIRSVCVYCGSSPGRDPAFAQAAQTLGRLLAENGLRLVFGGGNVGLMGIVAQAVLDHGGRVTGIIPDFLLQREGRILPEQETVVVPDMHTRKRLMFEEADAFVALPGGVGTLEELVEQLTWVQLGRHGKPVLMLNTAQFWKPLLVLLAHMRETAFIRSETEVRYLVAERPEEVIEMLRRGAREPGPATEAVVERL